MTFGISWSKMNCARKCIGTVCQSDAAMLCKKGEDLSCVTSEITLFHYCVQVYCFNSSDLNVCSDFASWECEPSRQFSDMSPPCAGRMLNRPHWIHSFWSSVGLSWRLLAPPFSFMALVLGFSLLGMRMVRWCPITVNCRIKDFRSGVVAVTRLALTSAIRYKFAEVPE